MCAFALHVSPSSWRGGSRGLTASTSLSPSLPPPFDPPTVEPSLVPPAPASPRPPPPPPLQWVFEELAPDLLPLLHQRVRATGAAGWTAAINWALGALPPRGIPAGALLGALRRAPWPADATVLLRRLAATPGVQVGIVSDANAAYIDTILDAAGLGGGGRGELLGAGVATNGAAVSPAGGLTVVPYTAGRQPHGCGRCPPNICKGEVVTGTAVRAGSGARGGGGGETGG